MPSGLQHTISIKTSRSRRQLFTQFQRCLSRCSGMKMGPWVRFSLALISCALVALIAWTLADPGTPRRPNILFILTDDQDVHMDSLSYMPYLWKHLIQEGTTFTKHFCTVALCCPARGVLWAGQAAHNTNVCGLASDKVSPELTRTVFRSQS